MVSLWPWTIRDASPASFEKALSALATRIATTQAKLDYTRISFRRVLVLCTLYLSFGYLVYAIVLGLVVGWRNMGAVEWSVVAGGPVVIYAVRRAVSGVYNYRIESLASMLNDQQIERAKTIQKLKDATKYDTTLQLLEKYGGGGETQKDSNGAGSSKTGAAGHAGGAAGGRQPGLSTPNRTNIPPPLTANIPRPGGRGDQPPSRQGTPRAAGIGSSLDGAGSDLHAGQPSALHAPYKTSDAEFAPNAFEPGTMPPPTFTQAPVEGQLVAAGAPPGRLAESHWYDRVLDLLLGEDETATKNRIVLICSACRLVNGQAPPGTRSLVEVGQWRCMGCGTLNGETAAAEAKAVVDDVLKEKSAATGGDVAVEDGATSTGSTGTDNNTEVRERRKK